MRIIYCRPAGDVPVHPQMPHKERPVVSGSGRDHTETTPASCATRQRVKIHEMYR